MIGVLILFQEWIDEIKVEKLENDYKKSNWKLRDKSVDTDIYNHLTSNKEAKYNHNF